MASPSSPPSPSLRLARGALLLAGALVGGTGALVCLLLRATPMGNGEWASGIDVISAEEAASRNAQVARLAGVFALGVCLHVAAAALVTHRTWGRRALLVSAASYALLALGGLLALPVGGTMIVYVAFAAMTTGILVYALRREGPG